MTYIPPKYIKSVAPLGNLTASFVGEHYTGLDILDTDVSINGKNLCCITWDNRDTFVAELNAVIEKYRI